MTRSYKIAFCGVMAALSLVILFLTGAVPVATLALPAIAGCFLIPVVAEAGTAWGFGVYAVCAALSFLIVPDREAALYYTLFFGYYPVAFAPLGKIKKALPRYAAKLLVFNAAMAAVTALSVFVLGIPLEQMELFGQYTVVIYFIILNIVFIIYDFALSRLIGTYFQRLHEKIKKIFRFK